MLEARRLFDAGDLDFTFGGGSGITSLGSDSGFFSTNDVAVGADGKTVVVGVDGSGQFAIARYNFDGSLDTTFGQGGIVHTSVGSSFSRANALAIQDDGKIVVVGITKRDLTLRFDPDVFAIARYLPDGSLDPEFDHDGKVTIRVNGDSEAHDVLIQGDGKIVVVGEDTNGSLTKLNLNLNSDFAVVRLNPNGSLDTTFNGDGKKTVGFGDHEVASAVAIDYSGTAATNPHFGKIILAGQQGDDFRDDAEKIALVRFTTKGNLDETFDSDGKVTARVNAFARASSIVVHPKGGYVIAGETGDIPWDKDFLLARFRTNGSLDESFGAAGRGTVEIDFAPGTKRFDDNARDVIISGDGGFLVGGISWDITGNSEKFALARLDANGILDEAFGDAGLVLTQASRGISALARGSGRRFVAAGGEDLTVARYLEGGNNIVVAGTFNATASELGPTSTNFIVGRLERLPIPTRVYFDVGGTANDPTTTSADYTVDGMVFSGTPYVDIPENQTFIAVTVTPIDDLAVEGRETAVFTIKPDSTYTIEHPAGATIWILDNEAATVDAIDAAHVRDGASASTNFGQALELAVRRSDTSGNTRETYLKFDLTGLTNVSSAKLRLHGRLSDSQDAGVAINVFDASNTTWTEKDLTWNNKPAAGSTVRGSFTVTGTAARWYEIDVSSFIRAAIAAGRSTLTLVLRSPTTTNSLALFDSDETDNAPQLLTVFGVILQ